MYSYATIAQNSTYHSNSGYYFITCSPCHCSFIRETCKESLCTYPSTVALQACQPLDLNINRLSIVCGSRRNAFDNNFVSFLTIYTCNCSDSD